MQIMANKIDGIINICGIAVQNGVNYCHSILFAKFESIDYGCIEISESQQLQYLILNVYLCNPILRIHLSINWGVLVHPSAFSKSSCSVCKSVRKNLFQTVCQSLSSPARMPTQYTKLLRFAGIALHICIKYTIIKYILC